MSDSRALTHETDTEPSPQVLFDQAKDDAEAERIFGYSQGTPNKPEPSVSSDPQVVRPEGYDIMYDSQEPAAPEREEARQDTWKISEDCVVRVHAVPRKRMFIPTAENMQGSGINLSDVDVFRETRTDLDTSDEKRIDDIWSGHDESETRELSNYWTGETLFYLYPTDKVWPPFHDWAKGRFVKRQQVRKDGIGGIGRPGDMWPETWQMMPRKQKLAEALAWPAREAKIKKARALRGNSHNTRYWRRTRSRRWWPCRLRKWQATTT